MKVGKNSFLKMEVPFFQVANDIFKVKIKNKDGKLIKLRIYEKMVYIFLARCANSGSAFPSYQTIADNCSISRRKAIDCVNVLFKHGLIIKHKRKKNNGNNNSNIYEINTNLKPYNDSSEDKDTPPSAQDSPPPSAQDSPPSESHAPYKELYINNKTEEEEGKTEKLSTGTKKYYKNIFNRDMSGKLEDEIIKLFTDEDIIYFALMLSEKRADKPAWLLSTLSDWKDHKLNSLESIKKYIKNRLNKSQNTKNSSLYKNLSEDEIAEKYYSKGYR